jgi:CTP synthase
MTDQEMNNTRFIVVSGGVMSGLGKGTVSACLGMVLKKMTCTPGEAPKNQKTLTSIKIDPYLNVDAGNMNPYEHGEVFVLDDGTQVDLDLGTYERFLDVDLTSANNITSGKIFLKVISDERAGVYLGQTVQLVPHFTNEVIRGIWAAAEGAQICIIELGGTIGDNESLIFTEALRQLKTTVGRARFCSIHVSLLPGEFKTKPTQHSVRTLRSVGLEPDFIVCRCRDLVPQGAITKISNMCGVPETHIIDMHDRSDIYEIPQSLIDQNFPQNVLKVFGLGAEGPFGPVALNFGNKPNTTRTINVAVVGKYTAIEDAYLSIKNSIIFAGWSVGTKVKITWLNSEEIIPLRDLSTTQCIIIPGGFGVRGIEGKIATAKYAREHKIPFLGICLGMQIAMIEYARNVLGLDGANSTEFDPATPHPIFELRSDGSLHLGSDMVSLTPPTTLIPPSRVSKIYGTSIIYERFRHRYETGKLVRNSFPQVTLTGMSASQNSGSVSVFEIPGQFYIGVQFHPEFKSRIDNPHPLFVALVSSIY